MSALELSPGELEIVLAILHRHVPEREVWAFGSRVAGPVKKFSDLDLAILGQDPLPGAVATDLAEAFSESDLPFRVDVVDWAVTDSAFRRIIENQYIILRKPGQNPQNV